MGEKPLHDVFFNSAFLTDPYPLYRRLRTELPVVADAHTGQWMVTRYADVLTVLRSPHVSNRGIVEASLPVPTFARNLARPLFNSLSRQMLFSDPPDHTRLRSLAAKAFTPRIIEAMRGRIEEVAEELLERVRPGGRSDLIRDLAHPLPVIVISELLGVPSRDRERFKAWSDDLAAFVGGTTEALPTVMARAAWSVYQLQGYFRGVVRRRRRSGHLGNDLIGLLLAAEEQGNHLSEEELLANCTLLLAAGHETTSNLIGNGIHALLEHPDQLIALREDPSLIETAVDEILRYQSPVQWAGRRALETLEVRGVRIPAGSGIALGLGSANRDPAQFRHPDNLDIRRADNRHIAFGFGIHFCLGSALARMEGQIAINAVLRKLRNLRAAEDTGRLPWIGNFTLRGLQSLPVKFD